ncbi:hypothetical protein FKG94_04435 [Exilibacterium tricleocarpae]|uniref:Uncharacterized protein n=1 Tax=Exilibacterium tricleocarpae TaxID=2591008 RepID=A0A545U5U0_9GAMM|nr:hypothetical protein [Exilibacterium tricleocarpae]TQV84773.1 hypothetical protein FKG94_04435 [Exilibacterium tricleocarpae]
MDNYEKIGYSLLAIIAALYLAAMLFGIVAAFPYGIIGLVLLGGVGVLLLKVVRERLNNKEDDYYSKKVDK